MLSGIQSFNDVFGMGIVSGGNEDGIDVLISKNVLFISAAEFKSEPFGHRSGTRP